MTDTGPRSGDVAVGPGEAAADGTESRMARRRALGAEIRSRRGRRGMSTVALARTCGVSPSLISQVERGLTAPSLDVLWAIATALDLPIDIFFAGTEEPGPRLRHSPVASEPRASNAVQVVRANERKRLGLTASLSYLLLSPDLQHHIELIWIELAPGEAGPAAPFSHPGEEQLVVIRGEARVWVGGAEWTLHAGDAITYDSATPHRTMNLGPAPAVIIAAITPPSF